MSLLLFCQYFLELHSIFIVCSHVCTLLAPSRHSLVGGAGQLIVDFRLTALVTRQALTFEQAGAWWRRIMPTPRPPPPQEDDENAAAVARCKAILVAVLFYVGLLGLFYVGLLGFFFEGQVRCVVR